MAYTLENVPSPNQTYDAARAAPTGIVIHHWGDDGQSHDGVVAHLVNRAGGTSAHYVVSAGRVTCLVDPLDTAWHAGVWPVNYQTVGIECRPEMTPEDVQTVVEVIAYLQSRFGALPLSGHKDYYATACPGRWYPMLGELSARASTVSAVEVVTPSTNFEEESMHLIRTTTPWNTYAYALVSLSGLGGARAIDQSEADWYYPVLGVKKVGWATWNGLVERAWKAHNDTLAALGKAISGSVEEAARRVVEEARAIAAPMPNTEIAEGVKA